MVSKSLPASDNMPGLLGFQIWNTMTHSPFIKYQTT